MTGVVVLLAAFVALGLYAFGHIWHQRMMHHGSGKPVTGFIVIGFRWLTGGTWHGGNVSDRGWLRPGSRALTSTGHVHRRHHVPRLKVAARRTGGFLGLLLACYGLLVNRSATLRGLELAAAAAVLLAAWRCWRWLAEMRHRRSWLAPLHATIHHQLGRPVTDAPREYISIERDRSRGQIALPLGISASPSLRRQLESDISARLGLEAPEFRWALAGPQPVLTFEQAPPPPDLVTLEMARPAIEAAKAGQLVIGLGKRSGVVSVSLAGESPHVLVNGPTGSGKSVTVRSMVAQHLYRGGFAVLMDHKELSHVWADSTDGTLPNIVYCRTDAEIHAMLLWLQGELRRRNSVARVAARRDGSIAANVGVRLLIVCEELNVMAARLRAYWAGERERDEPARSPAVIALNEVLFAGRQARMHVLQASQRAEANAVGGGAARENLVARVLIGRVQRPTWRMLAGEHEMPPVSGRQGRGFVVTGDVHEVQSLFMTPQEAWDLSLAGTVAAAPYGMPGAVAVTAPGAPSLPGGEGVTAPVVTPPPLLSLREFCTAHHLSLPAARMWRNRYRDRFPAAAGWDGRTELYHEAELVAWDESRRS